MDKKLFFYELEGRGYTFQNKNWDAAKHGFEDDMLNMAWEMWSSGQAAKAQVPEGFVLVEKDLIQSIHQSCNNALDINDRDIYKGLCMAIIDDAEAMIEAQEQSND